MLVLMRMRNLAGTQIVKRFKQQKRYAIY